MKLITLHLCPLMSFVSLLGTVALPAYSQPITPANDGTGTTVNQNGNQFNIQGGTHNGTNLFHSFGKFNLNSGQTANFISTPNTRNILGRITGGDPSRINGLIQVIGGNSNLFLVNPAGIMFGQNASLNIPASFSVTTATGIGFNSNNFWFQAIGTNDYSNLVGDPSGYNFNVSNPGAIVNEGNLSLNPGKDLTLAGGTVINTGELSTAGGNITIAAVNGGDTLRISQLGHLLSLDVSPTSNNLSGQSITPILLPELLTGGDIHHASSVVINAQGNLELTDTAGVAIASGNIDVSDTSTNGSVGGQVNVLGDRVAVIDANINANGLNGGGTILIGGDFQGNGIVPNSQQNFVNNNSIISADAINNGEGGKVIIWSDNTTNFSGSISAKGGDFLGDGGFVEISGKEELIFDGSVNVTAAFGEAGTILFDPKNIIIGESENSNESPEQNEADNVTLSLEELEGKITLQADNDITVNERIETSESVELKAGRNININADIDTSQGNNNISLFGNDNSADINNRDQGAGSINQREGTTLNSGNGDITIRLGNSGTNGDINLANLTTTGQLSINANQGNIRQVSPNSLITADRAIFRTQNSGGIGLAETPLRIDVNNLEVLTGEQGVFINSISNLTIGGVSEELTGISTRGGGNIELNIDGNFTAIEEVVTSVPDRQPGTITISSTGNIDTTQTTLKSNSESITGGDISLTADGNIQIGDINASTMGNDRGGNVTINSGGETDTTVGNIFSASSQGDGGNVSITSQGNIETGHIDSSSNGSGRGGNVTINSDGETNTTAGNIFSASSQGDGGNVSITSQGNIKTGYIDSRSDGSGNGGNITLKTTGGNVDTSSEELASFSVRGNGGNVSITSNGDIKTADIFSSAGDPLDIEGDLANLSPFETDNTDSNKTQNTNGSGGDITLKAEGFIDTSKGTIESFSRLGGGGSISITSKGDITTGEVFSTAGDPDVGNSVDNNPTKIQTEINSSNSGDITIESKEGAVTITAEIDTVGEAGNAGDLTIKAFGDINTESIESRTGGGEGGDITIESIGGTIDTIGTGTETAGIFSASINGDAGNITIKNNGKLTTGNIDSTSLNGKGGNINLESTTGNVDTSLGNIASLSETGNAGSVTIKSQGNINTGNIDSQTQGGQGGNISIESIGGSIETLGTDQDVAGIFADSEEGNAGNVTITSNGNLITGNIDSRSTNGQGGNITLKSLAGNIDTSAAEVRSSSRRGDAGTVSLTSQGNITTGSILSFAGRGTDELEDSEDSSQNESGSSNGGDITLKAGGTIDTTAGTNDRSKLESFSREGLGGNITLEAKGEITTAKILSTAGDPQASNPEDNGDITPLTETEINQRSSGNIRIESMEGAVTTTEEINSFATSGNGGSVTIKSRGNLTISDINSRSDVNGRGGNITLESTDGNIDTTNGDRGISSFSELGNAGDVTITSNGNLTTGDIDSRSDGDGQGGKITLESLTGNFDSSQGRLFSFSELGDAGGVSITSSGNLTTSDIDSRSKGSGQGGKITLKSTGGNIETTSGELSSFSESGNAGDVTITSSGNLTIGETNSSSKGSGLGGNITLESTSGNVDTTGGELSSFSESGNAGNVTITVNGNIQVGTIESFAGGSGKGGNISITADGAIDASIGELVSSSQTGEGGNITLSATGDISTGLIESFSGAGARGGNITLETINGNIDTTAGFLGEEANIPTDADVSSENVATIFEQERANLSSYAPEGTGGNIVIIQRGQGDITTSNISSFGGESSGAVSITNYDGNINTGVIFSTAINGTGDRISIETVNNGDLNINHIATYSTADDGTGGQIELNASGVVNINNVASFGNAGSGDVSIASNSGSINTGTIQTRAPNGTSGNITLNTFSTQGDIRTANVSTEGGEAAGQVEIIAPDGSVTTEDLQSLSESGNAGGIDVQAGEDIETGDQTVDSATGDSNINNQAVGNITTGDQTATTQQGDANINNQAVGNITTGDQTATTQQGDANINNQAVGNITTGDQTAVTNQGNASINNQAVGNITTGDQTAVTNQGNASINNQAVGNITTGDQIAVINQGNASINNQAVGNITTGDQIAIGDTTSIINLPGGELNTGEIIQISPPPSTPIDNTLPQQLPQISEKPSIPAESNLVQPTTTPTIPTNNILQSNNPISNLNATNITQSIQSNSTISTTNNPNLPNKKSDRQQININTDTKTILKNINILNNTPLTVAANSQTLTALEQNRNNEFTDHFGEDLSTQNTSIKNIREVLTDIARETGKNSAIIYVTAYPEELQLVLYTPDSDPILKTVPAANRQQLMEVVLQLRFQVTTPSRRNTQSYLPPAQKLYNWLIAPISAELEAANIDTLLFSMDEGLRTLPVAALHDGQQFLVEKYSLSLIPSISLMDTNYRPIQDTRVLAMGASEFIEQNSLPAVPVELKTISQQLWQGSQFLNQDFTRNNLLTQRQNYPYPIIHLATHAEFRPGAASNSYIQLWGDEQLHLGQMRQLGWNDPPVELLVLSACRTAVGDKNAELGFAGLAVAAGAKSALASVWYVSDEGTLGLMTEFYTQLNNAKIKAEALRQAQLAMLRGEVVIAEGQLRGTAARGAVVLPSELGKFENQNLSHPYYWAGFMMIGSPW
ncbi:CHAT domain-containing protein [Okeania sp. SIO1H4]|uniref:CHAT domain-containing protein n=1 Tax=Okeania sp. SIO1H4 TaxID=2607776 RepID=UPI0013CC4292|nr:CHAT domain-containing protein [Okeania sp. SIO1H4]NES75926.1 CHAT domain-containing protein [Okeania sp. SIO1H4]